MARAQPRWRIAAVALAALAGVSCGQGSTWYGNAAAKEARVTASEGAAGDPLAQALQRHVKMLSDDIGERSVVRGKGLDRARAYVHGAFEAAFLAEMLGHAGLGRTPELLGGGPGEDAFSHMLTREYAARIAETGALGLAEQVYQTLRDRIAP